MPAMGSAAKSAVGKAERMAVKTTARVVIRMLVSLGWLVIYCAEVETSRHIDAAVDHGTVGKARCETEAFAAVVAVDCEAAVSGSPQWHLLYEVLTLGTC